jgi:hypothetical protein
MRFAQSACYFFAVGPVGWSADWVWGLALIVLTVLIHVSDLGLISHSIVHSSVGRMIERRHPRVAFVVAVGAMTLLATCLHGIEADIWALTYRFLGALSDFRTSMLYSLNAMTSYGHTNLELSDHWHLMGALEAVNGWLFGLSTAFLFAVIEKVWVLGGMKEHR